MTAQGAGEGICDRVTYTNVSDVIVKNKGPLGIWIFFEFWS